MSRRSCSPSTRVTPARTRNKRAEARGHMSVSVVDTCTMATYHLLSALGWPLCGRAEARERCLSPPPSPLPEHIMSSMTTFAREANGTHTAGAAISTRCAAALARGGSVALPEAPFSDMMRTECVACMWVWVRGYSFLISMFRETVSLGRRLGIGGTRWGC